MATSTGCYLLAVVAEPVTDDHKQIILERLNKGFLSWDASTTGCDLRGLENVCASVKDKDPSDSDVLIQYSTESLGVEVLVNPPVSTLKQCLRNLLTSTIGHKHIIHAGYTFTGTGSWILQNGAFSFEDFLAVFQDSKSFSQRGSTIHIHCVEEGDWKANNFSKEEFSKIANVSLNPPERHAHLPGSEHLVDCLESVLTSHSLTDMMEASPLVGNIRFNRPTLYLFPAGEGDCALFGINGFNMLIDGGFNRKPCAWEFIRHLDRLDAVLVTQLSESNLCSMSTLMERKVLNNTYPQIGYVFCNIAEGKNASPVKETCRDKNDLLISVVGEGHRFIQTLHDLKLVPHQCWRDSVLEPFVLYHKVGHGTLEMHILSPPKDGKEMVDFLAEWGAYKEKFSSVKFKGQMAPIPLSHATSVCAILVWRPNDPKDTITRILFPGSAPQSKIFEGLDKLKALDILKHPTVTKASLNPLVLTKPKVKSATPVSKTSVPNRKNTASPALSVNSVASRNGDIGVSKKDTLLAKDTRAVKEVKNTVKESKKEMKPKESKKEVNGVKKEVKKEMSENKKEVKKEVTDVKREVKKEVKKDVKKETKPSAEKSKVTAKKVETVKATPEAKKTSTVKKAAPKKETSTKPQVAKSAEKTDSKKVTKTVENKLTKEVATKKSSDTKTASKPKTKPTHATTKSSSTKSKPTAVSKSPSKLTRAIAASAAVATAAVTVGVAEFIGSKQEEMEKDEVLKIEVEDQDIKLPEPLQNGFEEMEEHIEIPLSPARFEAASPALSEPVSLTASDTLSSAPMETVSPTPPIQDINSPAEDKYVNEIKDIDQQTPTDFEGKFPEQEEIVKEPDNFEIAENAHTPIFNDDAENAVDEGIVEDNVEEKIETDFVAESEEHMTAAGHDVDAMSRSFINDTIEQEEPEFTRVNIMKTEAVSDFKNEVSADVNGMHESVEAVNVNEQLSVKEEISNDRDINEVDTNEAENDIEEQFDEKESENDMEEQHDDEVENDINEQYVAEEVEHDANEQYDAIKDEQKNDEQKYDAKEIENEIDESYDAKEADQAIDNEYDEKEVDYDVNEQYMPKKPEIENEHYDNKNLNDQYDSVRDTNSHSVDINEKDHVTDDDAVYDIDEQLAKASMEGSFCAGYAPENQTFEETHLQPENVEYNTSDIPESMKTSIYEEREPEEVNDDYVERVMSQYKESSEEQLQKTEEVASQMSYQNTLVEAEYERHPYPEEFGNDIDDEDPIKNDDVQDQSSMEVMENSEFKESDFHQMHELQNDNALEFIKHSVENLNSDLKSFQVETKDLPESDVDAGPTTMADETNLSDSESDTNQQECITEEKRAFAHYQKRAYTENTHTENTYAEEKSHVSTEKQYIEEKDHDSAEEDEDDDGEMIIHSAPVAEISVSHASEYEMQDPIGQHYINPLAYKCGNTNDPLYEEQEYSGSERSSPVLEQPIFSSIDKADYPELVTVSGGTTPSEPQSPKSPLDSKKGTIPALDVMEVLSEHDCSESSNQSPLVREVQNYFEDENVNKYDSQEQIHETHQHEETSNMYSSETTMSNVKSEMYQEESVDFSDSLNHKSELPTKVLLTHEYEQHYEGENFPSELSEQVASGLHYEDNFDSSKPEFGGFDRFDIRAQESFIPQNVTDAEIMDYSNKDYQQSDYVAVDVPPSYGNNILEESSVLESDAVSAPEEFSAISNEDEFVKSDNLESGDQYCPEAAEQNRYSSASTIELDNFKQSNENFSHTDLSETEPVSASQTEGYLEGEKSCDPIADDNQHCQSDQIESGCADIDIGTISTGDDLCGNSFGTEESLLQATKVLSCDANEEGRSFSNLESSESKEISVLQENEAKLHADEQKRDFIADPHYQSDSPESDNSMKPDTPEILSQSDSENEPIGGYDVVNNKYLYNSERYPYDVAAPSANEFDVVNEKFLYRDEYPSDNLNNVSSVPLQQTTNFDSTKERFGEASEDEGIPGPGNISPYAYTNEAYNQEDDADGNHIYKPPADSKEASHTGNTHATFQDNSFDSHQVSGMTYSPGFPELHAADPSYDFRLEEWGKPMGLPTPPETTTKTVKKTTKTATKTVTKVSEKKSMDNGKSPGLSKLTSSPLKKAKEQETESKPVYVDLAYVPHHGDPNYSAVEFFRRIRARYYVFSGINPSKEVLNALLEAKKSWKENLEVTIIPTYETDTLGYWLAQNQDTLAAHSIEVAPSASRCTVNLQDHETSCAAYRLEF